MNSANTNKKKLSEYQIDDIKQLFVEVLKKISSKVVLLEIGNDFINIALAKSQKNKLYIKKVLRQDLPSEALDKCIPTDPKIFGEFLKQILIDNKINTNRVAVCLPSDACYTRLIEIPEEVNEENSKSFLENPNSGIQIPISLKNSDFEINLSDLPKKEIKNKIYNNYFLTSLPKKNVDIILDSIKNANLEICSIQMSHMCIANILKTEIDKLNKNELIISIDLLDQFTQFVIFDRSGPLLIKRLASIRNYPSIDEMKKINNSNTDKVKKSNNQNKSENYHALSKLDIKVLLREIKQSYVDFLDKYNLDKKGKIFLSGRNSQHKNLHELIGKSLKIDVALVSPVNNFAIKEFSYNPDEINQFSMSRIIGLGLSLLKSFDLEDESFNRNFINQYFSFEKFIKEESKDIQDNKDSEEKTVNNLMDSLNKLNQANKKIKAELKPKSEDKKKELPPLTNIKIKDKAEPKPKSEDKKKELPPLPNIKKKVDTQINKKDFKENKEKLDKNNKNIDKQQNKSFKMDTSFLKND